MMNPLPEPSRGALGSSAVSRRQRGPAPRDAASTLTTAAFTRAATDAKSTVPGAATGAAATTSGVPPDTGAVAGTAGDASAAPRNHPVCRTRRTRARGDETHEEAHDAGEHDQTASVF